MTNPDPGARRTPPGGHAVGPRTGRQSISAAHPGRPAARRSDATEPADLQEIAMLSGVPRGSAAGQAPERSAGSRTATCGMEAPAPRLSEPRARTRDHVQADAPASRPSATPRTAVGDPAAYRPQPRKVAGRKVEGGSTGACAPRPDDTAASAVASGGGRRPPRRGGRTVVGAGP
ncbi:hypothetical protein ABZW18_14335, partial [Streptomyces sp. NPDC004647]